MKRAWCSVGSLENHYAFGVLASNGAVENVIAVIKQNKNQKWDWYVAASFSGTDQSSGKDFHWVDAMRHANEFLVSSIPKKEEEKNEQ